MLKEKNFKQTRWFLDIQHPYSLFATSFTFNWYKYLEEGCKETTKMLQISQQWPNITWRFVTSVAFHSKNGTQWQVGHIEACRKVMVKAFHSWWLLRSMMLRWCIEACHKVVVMVGFKEPNHGVEWWVRTCEGATKVQRFSSKGLGFSLEVSNRNPIEGYVW
jgi:hypothetical protein